MYILLIVIYLILKVINKFLTGQSEGCTPQREKTQGGATHMENNVLARSIQELSKVIQRSGRDCQDTEHDQRSIVDDRAFMRGTCKTCSWED